MSDQHRAGAFQIASRDPDACLDRDSLKRKEGIVRNIEREQGRHRRNDRMSHPLDPGIAGRLGMSSRGHDHAIRPDLLRSQGKNKGRRPVDRSTFHACHRRAQSDPHTGLPGFVHQRPDDRTGIIRGGEHASVLLHFQANATRSEPLYRITHREAREGPAQEVFPTRVMPGKLLYPAAVMRDIASPTPTYANLAQELVASFMDRDGCVRMAPGCAQSREETRSTTANDRYMHVQEVSIGREPMSDRHMGWTQQLQG
jgi:hypothetical protein